MEPTAPEYSLIVWMLLMVANLVLILVVLFHLLRNKAIDRTESLGWIFAIVLVPFLGALIYWRKAVRKHTI